MTATTEQLKIERINFTPELQYQTARSGGSGGQHVNKVATKIVLRFDVINSNLLTERQKEKLLEKLSNRINKEGVLVLSCDSSRSQLRNKRTVTFRFYELLKEAFRVEKKRIPTKMPRGIKAAIKQKKRQRSEVKKNRKFNYRDFLGE